MKKPSMRDIGKAAGVSAVTVSKALAGKPGMSDQVRERIQDIARNMGYQYPTESRTGKNEKLDIGVLIPEKFFENDSFYSVMYKKLVLSLSAHGHFCLLELLTKASQDSLVLPNLLSSRHVDGLILLGQPNKEYYRFISSQSIPVVFLDFYDEQGCADAVVGDNTYGGYRLTNHLIKNGHERIGFVGNVHATSSIMDRFLGYYRALLMNGIGLRDEWIISDRELSGDLCDLVLPDELPTAFVCNCDLVACKLIECLRARGLRVPEDISVVGFDDFGSTPGFRPALSTFRIDIDSMIDLAVKAITERCTGSTKPFGRMVVGGQPVYRDSDLPVDR